MELSLSITLYRSVLPQNCSFPLLVFLALLCSTSQMCAPGSARSREKQMVCQLALSRLLSMGVDIRVRDRYLPPLLHSYPLIILLPLLLLPTCFTGRGGTHYSGLPAQVLFRPIVIFPESVSVVDPTPASVFLSVSHLVRQPVGQSVSQSQLSSILTRKKPFLLQCHAKGGDSLL